MEVQAARARKRSLRNDWACQCPSRGSPCPHNPCVDRVDRQSLTSIRPVFRKRNLSAAGHAVRPPARERSKKTFKPFALPTSRPQSFSCPSGMTLARPCKRDRCNVRRKTPETPFDKLREQASKEIQDVRLCIACTRNFCPTCWCRFTQATIAGGQTPRIRPSLLGVPASARSGV